MTKEKNNMTNEHNFNVGDRVIADDAEYSGIVTAVDDIGCDVRFDDGEETWILKDLLHHSDDTPYDRRTAFLTRLQSLLREFDAHIEPCGCEIEGLSIVLKDNEEIYYKMDDFSPMRNLTADNIMAFDKEGV